MRRARVLHAVDEFGRRSETFVYTCVTHHADFEAAVLCHARTNEREFPFPRVHVEPKPRSRRTVEWWLAASIERAGGRSPWRRRVERLMARLAPDVVHAHFGPIACELAPITHALGVPLVASLYGVDAAVLPYLPEWRPAYARLFRDGARFLAEGPEMRKKVIAAGAPPNRTALQPIAIDLARYPRWSPDPDPSVLFVGRFVEKKGLMDAIAAFAQARRSISGARLVVIGAGPGEDAARALTGRLGLDAAVEFAGMQPHAAVIAAMVRARAIIHPSATAADGDSEGGAPTILLEAQAIGVPIVTTRHADIPHVVPAGPGVFLCGEHDVDALADALVAAVVSPQPVSPAYVAACHDSRHAMAQLERHYREAMERAAAA